MNGTVIVGPIDLELWDPTFNWTSTADGSGMRGVSIGGMVRWPQGKQLAELVDNPDRSVTIGSATGVLEYIYAGDALLRDFTGWYLLQSAPVGPQQSHSLGDDPLVPISISATYVGAHRQAIVSRSARARTNSFGLAGKEVLAAPLTVSTETDAFAAEPGGTAVARAFDASHGDAVFGDDVVPRSLELRVGAVGSIATLVLPTVEDDASPPAWVADRGGDCRAFDVSEGREVYGPSHPLQEPSDLVITNGMLWAWCGARGITPYFTIAAFADGAWRQVGHVVLANESGGPRLDGARLVKVTPDKITAALRIRGLGDVFVSLQRGERMLRVQHGTTRAPTTSTIRRIGWLGTPPTSYGIGDAAGAAGEFGSGGLAPGDAPVVFQWPKAATREGWSHRGCWLPTAAAAAQGSSGVFTIIDADGAAAATLWFDTGDNKLKLEYGAHTLTTAALTFGAGNAVQYEAGFDTVDGLRLTVDAQQLTDRTVIAPSTSAELTRLALFGGPGTSLVDFGDGDFGDGPFGGEIYTPGGVVDELYIFGGRLSDEQGAAIVTQVTQLDAVPFSPRPVWYASLDAGAAIVADAFGSGRRVETAFDGFGFKRMTAALQAAMTSPACGVRSTADVSSIDLAAALVTAVTSDGPADVHDQFATAFEQETRIR